MDSDSNFAAQYQGTQASSHCNTYNETQDSATFDWAVFALEIAGALACGAACLTEDVTSPYYTACQWIGGAAMAAEVAAAVILWDSNTETTGETIGTLMGVALNLKRGWGGLVTGGSKGNCGAIDLAAMTGVKAGVNAITDEETINREEANCPRQTACLATFTLTLSAVIRYSAIQNFNDSHDEACTNIQSLSGSSNTVTREELDRLSRRYVRQAMIQLLRDMEAFQHRSAPPSVFASTSPLPPSKRLNFASTLDRIGRQGFPNPPPKYTSGKDLLLLREADGDRLAASLLQNIDFEKLKKTASSKAPVSAATQVVGNATEYAGKPIVEDLGELSDYMASHRKDFPSSMMGSDCVDKAISSPHNTLTSTPSAISKQPEVPVGQPASNKTLGQSPETSDIFHQGSSESIFDIVSKKIRDVASRVSITK